MSAPDPQARKGEYLVPVVARMNLCLRCRKPIVFGRTAHGRAVPLSLITTRIDDNGSAWALTHFADCPSADAFRKGKKASGDAPNGNGEEATSG